MASPRRAGALRRGVFTIALVACGVALPFVRVAVDRHAFALDMDWFRGWADCLATSPRDVYVACKPPSPLGAPDYPALGVAASAGALVALRDLAPAPTAEGERQTFRLYLAALDAIAFLLLAWLARTLRLARPLLVAFAVMLFPSSWTSTAAWGQIDALLLCGVAISMASVFALASARPPRRAARDGALLALAAASAGALLLVKQITLLSAPFLAALLAFGAWRAWERHGRAIVPWLAGIAVAGLGAFRALDAWFRVPPGFGGSSLRYTFYLGNLRSGSISGNGFNVWMLLGRDMWSSARVPFVTGSFLGKAWSLSPYDAGFALFGAYLAATGLVLARAAWASRSRVRGAPAPLEHDRWLLSAACLFFGLWQLAFNVLLTGTHERYLYLGYPFLLLGVASFVLEGRALSVRLLLAVAAGAIAYGSFVYSILAPLPALLFPFGRHEFLCAVHLGLLVVLTDAWVRLAWRRRPRVLMTENGDRLAGSRFGQARDERTG